MVGGAMSPRTTALVDWREATPVAVAFGDPYFSLEGGLAEARHVFLAGNGLPGRFSPGFRIAELGFGTGLNLAAALLAFRAAGGGGRLCYTGFEAFPLAAADMDRALAAVPEVAGLRGPLLRLAAEGVLELDDLSACLVTGDARVTLPGWGGRADAWFLDGFAPARNPEMWEPELLAEVARHTAPGGSFATYTAAGGVRRALAAAGFAVERRAGFGRKRHMTAGRL
jgi:tRNA U34 5-methylaminomethyl-2-thiouridine-forming methyltransferase MnmC